PYVATDLEYYQGAVYYVAGTSGYITRVDTTTGVVTALLKLNGFDVEAGTTIHDGVLYATDANGTSNTLQIVDLDDLEPFPLASNLPALSSSLEYSPVKDRYYFTDVTGSRVMQITPEGAVTPLA